MLKASPGLGPPGFPWLFPRHRTADCCSAWAPRSG